MFFRKYQKIGVVIGIIGFLIANGRQIPSNSLSVSSMNSPVELNFLSRYDHCHRSKEESACNISGDNHFSHCFSNRIPQNDDIIISPSPYPYVPAWNPQFAPDICYDGTDYFAVWEDWRQGGGYDSRIFGARIDASGNLIDTVGIRISLPNTEFINFDSEWPSVIFGGNRYFTVWMQKISGAFKILGARVLPTGEVIDTIPTRISQNPAYNHWYPEVSAGNGVYLVSWEEEIQADVEYDVFAARVDTNGNLLDSTAITLCDLPFPQYWTSVAFDDSNFFVVWMDARNGTNYAVYGARVSSDGVLLDPGGILIYPYATHPSISFDGTNYLIVYEGWEDLNDTTPNIYASKISPSGLIDTTFKIVDMEVQNYYPAVCFDGTNYVVAWEDLRTDLFSDVYGARVTPQGQVLDPNGKLLAGMNGIIEYYPSVFGNGQNTLVAFERDVSGGITGGFDLRGVDIFEVFTDNLLNSLIDSVVSKASITQRWPSASYDGENYFVVWNEEENYTGEACKGARVTPSGAVLDTAPILIMEGPASIYWPYGPAIVYDNLNSKHFIVWSKQDGLSENLFGAFVDKDGSLISTFRITESGNNRLPTVAFDGVQYYMVTWVNTAGQLRASRIQTDGTIIDTALIYFPVRYVSRPSISFDDTNFLVVFSERGSFGWSSDICGIFISPDGNIVDTILIYDSPDFVYSDNPSVCFDGTNYFVVWDQQPTSAPPFCVYGAQISPQGGILIPPFPISSERTDWRMPTVAYDGTEYFVAWQEKFDLHLYYWDIMGARVDLNGQILDTFKITEQEERQNLPFVVSNGQGQSFVVYENFTLKEYNSLRIVGQFFPPAGIEEQNLVTPGSNIRGIVKVYPNPASGEVKIDYATAVPTFVSLKIYDTAGRLVVTLANADQNKGRYLIQWDGLDDCGRKVNAGVYFVRYETEGFNRTEKLILLK